MKAFATLTFGQKSGGEKLNIEKFGC